MKSRVLVGAEAHGRVVALDEPLSFWGGVDPATGRLVDQHHPQVGTDLAGAVVVMASGRGSSSASAMLAETVRRGTAPAALVLLESDEILVAGSVVADELYGRPVPIVVVDKATFVSVAAATEATLTPEGTITLR